MTLSMHQAAAPPMIATLKALCGVLDKAEAAVKAGQFSEAELMEARLAPDMFALPRQVQVASDMAKGGLARLAGKEPPSWADEEKTLAELRQRVARTVEYLEAIPAADVDGSEDRAIQLKLGPGGAMVLDFTGQSYLLRFVLNNFYFHCATAYDILRAKGLALEKRDFIGGF